MTTKSETVEQITWTNPSNGVYRIWAAKTDPSGNLHVVRQVTGRNNYRAAGYILIEDGEYLPGAYFLPHDGEQLTGCDDEPRRCQTVRSALQAIAAAGDRAVADGHRL